VTGRRVDRTVLAALDRALANPTLFDQWGPGSSTRQTVTGCGGRGDLMPLRATESPATTWHNIVGDREQSTVAEVRRPGKAGFLTAATAQPKGATSSAGRCRTDRSGFGRTGLPDVLGTRMVVWWPRSSPTCTGWQRSG
jgi:hypothetical protein